MSVKKGTPVRFSLLTILVWLLVAAGTIFLLWQLINRISASKMPISTPTPNLTQIYQTIAAILTSQPTSPATPTSFTGTPTPIKSSTATSYSPVPSPHSISTAGNPTNTAITEALCNQAAAGNPIDVTIPDESLLFPGQSFIKTWKLVNAGTCTWTTSYSVSFFYGDLMSALPSVMLQESVSPSHDIEVSLEMVAPLEPGTYQGNWKLADPSGNLFGIGPSGDSPFWVRIIVAESLTGTPGPTSGPEPTSTPTGSISPTSTSEGQVSGVLSPMPGDNLDLDAVAIKKGGADLVYQEDANQYHWLTPSGEARIGVYGNQPPLPANCKAAKMSPAPIAVESLPIGTYLCYHTGVGRYGRMQLESLDSKTFILTLELLTWASP